MDVTQLWIPLVFLVVGYFFARAAKRWHFNKHDDARRARWVFGIVWLLFIVLGVAFFAQRSL